MGIVEETVFPYVTGKLWIVSNIWKIFSISYVILKWPKDSVLCKCTWRTLVAKLNINIFFSKYIFHWHTDPAILNPYEYWPILWLSKFHEEDHGLIWMKCLLYLCFFKGHSCCWESFIWWIKMKWELLYTYSLLPWEWSKFLWYNEFQNDSWFEEVGGGILKVGEFFSCFQKSTCYAGIKIFKSTINCHKPFK
jgi:hypothetical protein